MILVSFRGYGRLILQKYDVFNSIQFILIVFWGKAWLCLPPRSLDMNTRTGLAPRTLPVHLMQGCAKKDTEKEMMIAGRANF